MGFNYGNYYDNKDEEIEPQKKNDKLLKKQVKDNLENEKKIKKENKKSSFFSNKLNVIIIGLIIAIIIVIILMFLPSELFYKDKNNSNNDNQTPSNDLPVVTEKIDIIDLDSNTRPFAIMINCHKNALPQSGLQDAYIVYELMVEYGITRMMALYKDIDFSKVGSIRSARTQYLDYVLENDAIYVHAGGAKDALNEINTKKLADIDVDGKYGERDRSLKRDWEHTLFTNTNLLNKAINDKKLRNTTSNGNLLTYSVEEIDLSNIGTVANNISIKYSNYRTSKYTYDPITKTYLRYMNNTKNTDLVTNEQYQVKNIIVYGVKYSTYTYQSTTKYQKIDNIGTGEGLYITNGYSIPITWEKKDESSKTVYKNKITGEILKVNDGNTYIQIYPLSGNLEIN